MEQPMEISNSQIRAINVTLGVRGLADDKPDIVSIFTNGRTDQVSDMHMHEARALLMAYNTPDKNSLMLRKLFAQAHELGWIKEEAVVTDKGIVAKKNYAALYDWVKKYGYLKKELRQYNYNELPKLITQFEEGPYKHYISNARK